MRFRFHPLRAAGAAGAIAIAFGLVGCDRIGDKLGLSAKPPAPVFVGADITGATYAQTLALPDTDGQPRTLGDFKGKVVVVFFGYTQCPDVCPTTMAELAQVKKALGPNGDKLQAVFVTIDPERDTPTILKAYMASFDPSFVALRGSLAQTQAVAKEFKVYYAKVPGKAEGSYTMDHSAGSFIIDPEGHVRLFERYGAGADGLLADIKALMPQA